MPLGLFGLTLVGVAFVHLGVNLANDYFDHRGTDAVNERRTMFNGGSGFIQAGWATPRQMGMAACAFLGTAGLIGAYLASVTGPALWVLIGAGLLLGIGYSAPPLSLMGTGWGEVIAGLCCGPLVAIGAHWVLGGEMMPVVILASVPIGLLVSAILVVNELPDLAADAMTGKANLVVRWGSAAGVRLHQGLVAAAYLVVLAGIALRWLPQVNMAILLTLPLALRAARDAQAGAATTAPTQAMVAASAGTVGVHLLVSLVVSISFLW